MVMQDMDDYVDELREMVLKLIDVIEFPAKYPDKDSILTKAELLVADYGRNW